MKCNPSLNIMYNSLFMYNLSSRMWLLVAVKYISKYKELIWSDLNVFQLSKTAITCWNSALHIDNDTVMYSTCTSWIKVQLRSHFSHADICTHTIVLVLYHFYWHEFIISKYMIIIVHCRDRLGTYSCSRAVSLVYLGMEISFSKGSKEFSGVFNQTQPKNMLNWRNCGLSLANDFRYHVYKVTIIVKDIPNLFIYNVTLGSREALSVLCG